MKDCNEPFQMLVVDDDESQLLLIKHLLLKHFGSEVKVTTTSNIQMAIGLAVAHKVDICITDLDMPDKNGIGVLKKLKEINPLIPVVLLTAIASENALKSSLAFGADDYLLKPLKWEKLLETVRFQFDRLKRYHNDLQLNGEL